MLDNGLSMMLESELLSIGLIINFLDNGEDQLLVIIFWTNYKSYEKLGWTSNKVLNNCGGQLKIHWTN